MMSWNGVCFVGSVVSSISGTSLPSRSASGAGETKRADTFSSSVLSMRTLWERGDSPFQTESSLPESLPPPINLSWKALSARSCLRPRGVLWAEASARSLARLFEAAGDGIAVSFDSL